ncbi:RICIN domain-containing protein [Paractinoplanes atraurantiacus]|uniref:RICIN domain-containing protein n=1 Tax=Paractinoplanes atraurantiacus TaxID=1036182 RepID=UPI00117876E8|nr:ricin-type beta-trefoil lectin domain protein [Actinoplanes atraurantiacus]
MRHPRVLRGLLTVTVTATLTTLLAGPALAAPAPTPVTPSSAAPKPAAGAKTKAPASIKAADAAPMTAKAAEALAVDDGLPTSEEEKVRAANEIGVEADSEWLSQTDRNFVFKIWQNSENYALIRVAAELALGADNATVEDVCKEFILKGIFDAKLADDAKKISDEAAAREARDLKRAAYAAAGVALDTTGRMLTLSERDVVIEIWTKAAGARVKAAAVAVINGTAAQQHEFLATGVMAAAEQDVQDAIKAAEDAGAAEQARLAREGSMKAAAAILGIVADPGKLAMTDDNFVRWIWELVDTDENRIEIRAAAERALRSSDAAVWRAFIDTGMREADRRDLVRELAEREAADRAAVQSIRTKAQADGNDNIVTAATQALWGDALFVSDFIRVGQYRVAPDAANRPSAKQWQWSNGNSGLCLAADAESVTDGKQLVQTTCSYDNEKYRWIGMRVYNTGGQYRIINAWDRSKCVSLADKTGGGGANGVNFVIRKCDGGADQFFYYTKQGDNYVWTNELTNKAITVLNASKVAGAATITYDVNNGTNQQWAPVNTKLVTGAELSEAKFLHSTFGHTLRLQSDGNVVVSKGPRAVWATNTTTGTRFVNQRDGNLVLYTAAGAAIWSSKTYGQGPSTLKLQNDGNLVLYRNDTGAAIWSTDLWDRAITSVLNNKCVTAPSFTQGVQLEMRPCNGGNTQKFMFKDSFISFGGMCIDVDHSGTANGTKVQMWGCNNGVAQKWLFYSDGTIRNPNSGKCLDIPNSNTADGVKLDIWTCGTGNNHKWK